MGSILVFLVVGFALFFRYSRTEGWWQSETRKALLGAAMVVGPLFGQRFQKPVVEPPTISATKDEVDPPLS